MNLARIASRAVTGVALGCAVLAAVVAAAPANPTRGDAMAIARASLNGGLAISAHNAEASGAPGAFGHGPDGVRIDPTVEGATYCASGWHLISIGAGQPAPAGPKGAVLGGLRAIEIEFTLDGVALQVRLTPAHRYLNPLDFPGEIFAVNGAALLAPGSLSPGEHALVTEIERPGAASEVTAVRFLVATC